MGAPLPRPAALNARLETPIEEWPYLDESTLQQTCHWLHHHAWVNQRRSMPAARGCRGEASFEKKDDQKPVRKVSLRFHYSSDFTTLASS
jgi:hypothetical protein